MTDAPASRRLAFSAEDSDAGERIDRVIAERLATHGISRSMAGRMCDEGRVTVRGVVARASTRLKPGEAVVVDVPPPEPTIAIAEDIPLVVVFEDRDLMVIDKPAGLVVHPSKGHATGTLVNAVLHHADVDDDDTLRPGVVHRIDKDTSGLLVMAKTPAAREGLAAQFKDHSIERLYIALCEGIAPDRVTYDTTHSRHPTDRMRFTAKLNAGRRAVTHVTRVATYAGVASRVQCTLETGRTHQIRMHLSEAGFPLLGDALYGRRAKSAGVAAVASALGRQALHAAVLGFTHPVLGTRLSFRAEVPDDMQKAIKALEKLGSSAGTR